MELGRPPIAPLLPIAMIGIRHIPLAAIGKLCRFSACVEEALRPRWPMPLSKICCSCSPPVLAHRVISLPRGNRVAFGGKRTSTRAITEPDFMSTRPSVAEIAPIGSDPGLLVLVRAGCGTADSVFIYPKQKEPRSAAVTA